MAEQLQPDYNLFQQLAFLKAGGKLPGTSSGEQFQQGASFVGQLGNNVNSIISGVLANKKAALDQQSIGKVFGIPDQQQSTRNFQTSLGQAQEAPIPTQDLVSGHLDTMQRGIDSARQQAIDDQSKRTEFGKNFGGLSPEIPSYQFEKIAQAKHLLTPEHKNTPEDSLPATDIYTPDYIKSIFPNVPDAQRVNIKIGQVKSAITTNNQANLNEDRDLLRNNLQEDRAQRNADRKINMRTEIVKRFNSMPNVKKYQSSIDAADNVIDLISSNNPIADNAVPTYMARASGEVGNLSEPDKAPFGGSQALLDRMQQAVSQATAGKLTPENRQFVRQLAETMKKSAMKNMNNQANKFSQQEARIGGYGTDQDVLHMVNPGYEEENTQPQYEPDVMAYAQKHNITPEQAQQIKIKRTSNGVGR